jgi:CMP-N-acetylneuraminic acid synthetase
VKKIDDVCFVIQARLSSERVPRKMIRSFAGTNLTDIAIKKILKSDQIPKQNFYLSVYEQELIEVGVQNGVDIFHRSEESALWDGGKEAVLGKMYEWWDRLPYKYCVLISACNPFLSVETIDSFVASYLESESEGMFAVIEKKNYFWNKRFESTTPWPEGEPCMNTKVVEKTYEGAHCLYAGRLDKIGEGIWMGDFNKPGDIELFPISEKESLDIDYPWQFDLCEAYYKQTMNKNELE